MTPEIRDIAINCLERGTQELVRMYTDTALLMNACDVAAKGYDTRTDEFELSTTRNIPAALKLPVEIEVVYHRDDLPKAYRGDVLQRLAEDFLIRMVSVIDDVFEDIYEKLLPVIDSEISEKNIAKNVRSAWQQEDNGQVKLSNFLTSTAGLESPDGRVSKIDMVFDRYYEIREIRHALVHSAGVLSDKNSKRIKELSERLPVPLRDDSLANSDFLKDGIVNLTGHNILALRHWAYTTIIDYFQSAFRESVKA
ncbi:MAG: hypothetical protein V7708_04590 [Oceanicoccus sp.]